MKFLRSAVLALVLCSAAPPAFAMAVNFSFEGTVDVAVSGNIYGLTAGDKVTVSGMFDDVLTGSGQEIISFGAGTGNMLEVIAGAQTFNESDDSGFGTGTGPKIVFSDGALFRFDFVTASGAGAPRISSGLLSWILVEGFVGVAEGTWDSATFDKTPKTLPEPGTLGMTLLGLAVMGFSRKRKQPQSAAV